MSRLKCSQLHAQPSSRISVHFFVRSFLYYMSKQRRLWQNCADKQARLSLHCSHVISTLSTWAGSYINWNWAASSEFVSSSIPSWQISTAHAQPFRGARELAFCLKVPLDSLLVWASSGGSGKTARMRRLAWTFAARIGDKYQIRLARPN